MAISRSLHLRTQITRTSASLNITPLDVAMSLDSVAYQLCNEIRDGKFDHILDPRIKQPAANPKIIEELRKRCPGCTVQ